MEDAVKEWSWGWGDNGDQVNDFSWAAENQPMTGTRKHWEISQGREQERRRTLPLGRSSCTQWQSLSLFLPRFQRLKERRVQM